MAYKTLSIVGKKLDFTLSDQERLGWSFVEFIERIPPNQYFDDFQFSALFHKDESYAKNKK
jgi:hypothetical protein